MQSIIRIISLSCFLFGCNTTIKIFESTVHLEVENIVSGLRYQSPHDAKVTLSNSLTICIRFNLKRLGHSGSAKPFVIRNSNSKDKRSFSQLSVDPIAFFEFGNHDLGAGYYAGWILRGPGKHSFRIWRTDYWHNICFAYSKPTFHVSFVKVRMITKVFKATCYYGSKNTR